MKVTDLQAYLLSSPLARPIEEKSALGAITLTKIDVLLLRVQASNGLIGYALGPASPNLAQLINRNLKSAVVNTDPTKFEVLKRKVFEKRPDFPGIRQAYGLIEIALLDLWGKAEGCPIFQLLGASAVGNVPLIAKGGLRKNGEVARKEAEQLIGRGFCAYKLQLGMGPDTDLDTVIGVRETLPEASELVIGAAAWWQGGGQAYPTDRMLPWLSDVAKYSRVRVDDLFPAQDVSSYRDLASRKLVRTGAGEQELMLPALLLLAQNCVIDVILANMTLLGGITETRQLVQKLSTSGPPVVLTGGTTPCEVLALAQLAASCPLEMIAAVEHPFFLDENAENNLFALGADVLKEALVIENGSLVLPQASGLGIQVNERVIERYPWKSGSFR